MVARTAIRILTGNAGLDAAVLAAAVDEAVSDVAEAMSVVLGMEAVPNLGSPC